jgi:hypothetical protein
MKSLLPPASTARNLFVVGTTLGPIIDGLHNQSLLRYNVAPIVLDWPIQQLDPAAVAMVAAQPTAAAAVSSSSLYYEPHLFASSWIVLPLLGVAYVVLGGILPRLVQALMNTLTPTTAEPLEPNQAATTLSSKLPLALNVTMFLGLKALLAILSTAAIVSLSQELVLQSTLSTVSTSGSTHVVDWWGINALAFEGSEPAEQHVLLLITLALAQWTVLDGTGASLLSASLAAMLGPLAELPFIAANCWTYWPTASDAYYPLRDLVAWSSSLGPSLAQIVSGGTSISGSSIADYDALMLNSITGPCYFAVTMDAIAIGRWLDALEATPSPPPPPPVTLSGPTSPMAPPPEDYP